MRKRRNHIQCNLSQQIRYNEAMMFKNLEIRLLQKEIKRKDDYISQLEKLRDVMINSICNLTEIMKK